MEQYLIRDYDVIEDNQYLTSEESITDYFRECAYDYLDCGQGYYQDEVTKICKINDKFYEVLTTAEIGSSKQDRGDRLYWVESIESVTYKEIEKPDPKHRDAFNYKIFLTEYENNILNDFLDSNSIDYAMN